MDECQENAGAIDYRMLIEPYTMMFIKESSSAQAELPSTETENLCVALRTYVSS
jgi:hypothetical protein